MIEYRLREPRLSRLLLDSVNRIIVRNSLLWIRFPFVFFISTFIIIIIIYIYFGAFSLQLIDEDPPACAPQHLLSLIGTLVLHFFRHFFIFSLFISIKKGKSNIFYFYFKYSKQTNCFIYIENQFLFRPQPNQIIKK